MDKNKSSNESQQAKQRIRNIKNSIFTCLQKVMNVPRNQKAHSDVHNFFEMSNI